MDGSSPDQATNLPRSIEAPIVAPVRGMPLVLGCMLVILGGVVSLFNGFVAMLSGGHVDNGLDVGVNQFAICSVIVFIFGAVAVVGGTYSLVRRRISFALGGAALGMAGGGILGFWFGLISIVVLMLSNEDL
jgi:hypothetical protein